MQSESEQCKFGRMCRACLCVEQKLHSILECGDHSFPLRIYEMLATLAPQLKIETDDDLPKWICTICRNKLDIAYRFQQMCVHSDRCLHGQLTLPRENTRSIGNETPRTVGSGSWVEEQNPLAEGDFLPLQDCLKMEICESETKDFDLDALLVAEASAEESSKICESASEDWQPQASTKRTKRARGKTRYPSTRTSSMHNETGVDEIEKPNARNRRKGHYPCPECGKDFDRPYRLRRHISVHSALRPFQCDICKYRFSKEALLASHRTTHNTDGTVVKPAPPLDGYKCSECPRRFEKRESLAAHIQSHRKAEPGQLFKCAHCTKTFRKFTLLTKHARTHPENQKYKCEMCDKSFALNAHLIEHMNKHKGLKPFVCTVCDKAFQLNSSLKEHLRTHSNDKPFLCAQCGKSFKNSSNMQQHLLRHSGERRYQCPECPSRFICQSDQIKHMSIHRDTKPHVCDVCGSSFARSYTLKKHKQIHTGERPFKCDECNMTFVFIDHMRRHQRTHTGEKPYQCKFCERAYSESGDLNKHLRTHVGEKTYICSQCPEAFKYQAELRDHQTQHYKEQLAVAVTTQLSATDAKPTIDTTANTAATVNIAQ